MYSYVVCAVFDSLLILFFFFLMIRRPPRSTLFPTRRSSDLIWYGARFGVWPTTLVATAGTVAAALVDHQIFVPLIRRAADRSEEHTSELQSQSNLVCRLLLEKKKKQSHDHTPLQPIDTRTSY